MPAALGGQRLSVACCIVVLPFPELLGQRYREAAAHPAGKTTMTSPRGANRIVRDGNRQY